MIYMAVAVEQSKTPRQTTDYKVWYLEIGDNRNVQGIGVKSREELVQNLFENYRQTGKSNWRAFKKESEQSTPIEIYDFISMNINENTHFGNLPTLAEFQQTLDALSSNFELRSIA